MITFKSVGHFFAKAFTAIKNELPKIEAGLVKVEATEPTVEAVTVDAGASALVPIEKAAYASLGALSAVLAAGDAAIEAKLSDAGLDAGAISAVKALLATYPNLVALAKAL